MTICKRAALCLIFSGSLSGVLAQQNYTVTSPDRSVTLTVAVADQVSYNVMMDNKELIAHSVISFKTDAEKKQDWKVSNAKQSAHNEVLSPVIKQKSSTVLLTESSLWNYAGMWLHGKGGGFVARIVKQ